MSNPPLPSLIAVYPRAGKKRREAQRKLAPRPSSLAAQRGRYRRYGIAAVEGRYALEPWRHRFGMGLEPFLGCGFGLLAVVQDRTHDLIFHAEREFEIGHELSRIGTFADIALAHIRVDRGAAEIRPEHLIAAR